MSNDLLLELVPFPTPLPVLRKSSRVVQVYACLHVRWLRQEYDRRKLGDAAQRRQKRSRQKGGGRSRNVRSSAAAAYPPKRALVYAIRTDEAKDFGVDSLAFLLNVQAAQQESDEAD